MAEFLPHFTKYVTAFGSTVIGTPGLPDAKLIHSGGVWAQYLDNNADGIPDNKVAATLARKGAVVFMAKDAAEDTKVRKAPIF